MKLRKKPFSRAALGLFSIATLAGAMLLFAPVAVASPDSDAADAINAAWDAAGGDASQLGPRDGGVYPAGTGFGQNFAGGAIYFSPATGAKSMSGAILEKYRALGGPADGDLGFPNIDEGPGKVSPQSRNSTFSAGDKPVIFWTPDTGAWVVRGPINAAWDTLGGSAGVLGVPVADETYSDDVVSQRFTGGQLSFDTGTKMFSTDPPDLAGQLAGLNIPTDATSAIATVWRASGGPTGTLGLKQGDQYAVGDTGVGQNFAAGKVFFSPDTGAHAVTGDLLAEYEKAGGPTGDLGLPTAGSADGGVPGGRVMTFAAPDNPVIFWTKEHGAIVVRGAMKAAWDKLGGATAELGVPVSEQNTENAITTQKFSGGEISWDAKNNTFKTDPANLAAQLSGLEVPAAPVPSTPVVPPAGEKNNNVAWHNWWLWWIVPLAVLLLGSLFAWVAMRRREARAESAFDFDYTEVPDGNDHWTRLDSKRYADPDAEQHSDSSAATMRIDTRPDSDFTYHGAHENDEFDDDEDVDTDDLDTDPTGIPALCAEAYDNVGRHARTASDDDPYPLAPGSLFAPGYGSAPPPQRRECSEEQYDEPFDGPDEFAELSDERESSADSYDSSADGGPHDGGGTPPAIHLPLDDPYEAPEGYPVKGSMRTGRYHVPGSQHYDETVGEIWFASVDLAEGNGFLRAD